MKRSLKQPVLKMRLVKIRDRWDCEGYVLKCDFCNFIMGKGHYTSGLVIFSHVDEYGNLKSEIRRYYANSLNKLKTMYKNRKFYCSNHCYREQKEYNAKCTTNRKNV